MTLTFYFILSFWIKLMIFFRTYFFSLDKSVFAVASGFLFKYEHQPRMLPWRVVARVLISALLMFTSPSIDQANNMCDFQLREIPQNSVNQLKSLRLEFCTHMLERLWSFWVQWAEWLQMKRSHCWKDLDDIFACLRYFDSKSQSGRPAASGSHWVTLA